MAVLSHNWSFLQVVAFDMFPGATLVIAAELAPQTPPRDLPIICEVFLHQLQSLDVLRVQLCFNKAVHTVISSQVNPSDVPLRSTFVSGAETTFGAGPRHSA